MAQTRGRKLNNILVTGGAGFIGSNFINYLFGLPSSASPDYMDSDFKGRIINVDCLTYAGNLENLALVDKKFGSKAAIKDRRYFFEKVDICNRKEMERIFSRYNIDTVINFAAESHVDRSISEPDAFIKTNVVGTFTLLDVAKNYWNLSLDRPREDVVFHHVSTDEVYGSLGEEGLFSENTAYNPRSPYSASKASSDHIVMAYHYTYGLPVTLSNCSNNYGPCQFPEKFLPLMILNILDGKKLPLYGDGRNVRDWIYVEDHNRALWQIVKQGRAGQKYNIGGENEWKNIDLLHKVIEITALKVGKTTKEIENLIHFIKDRPGHDVRYAMDCSKIKKELGWKQKMTFEEGLSLTVDWYLSHKDWLNKLRRSKCLVWLVGYDGMLGSQLCKDLTVNGIPFIGSNSSVDICDFKEVEDFTREKNISFIVNCGAYTQVDNAENDRELAFKINAKGPENLAKLAEKIEVPLIHISTDYVFDGKARLPIKENAPLNPINVYGESKAEGEKSLTKQTRDYYILRSSWLYGFYGQNFVYKIIKVLNSAGRVKVVSDQKGSPTNCKTLTGVILKIISARIEGKKVPNGIYNVTDLGECSWFEFAEEICRLGKRNAIISNNDAGVQACKSQDYPSAAARPLYSVLDKGKIQKELSLSLPDWKSSLQSFMSSDSFDITRIH